MTHTNVFRVKDGDYSASDNRYHSTAWEHRNARSHHHSILQDLMDHPSDRGSVVEPGTYVVSQVEESGAGSASIFVVERGGLSIKD